MNVSIENPTVSVISSSSLKEQLIADIFLLGMKAHHNTERCVFVEFRGHIDHLDISVRESRDNYGNELAATDIRLIPYSFFNLEEREAFEQELIEKLEETKNYLTAFAQNGELDTGGFLKITTTIF